MMVRKSKEADAAYMRRYRKRKKIEERERLEKLKVLDLDAWLLATIQSFPEYKRLPDAEKQKIDQIIVDFTTKTRKRVETFKAEIETRVNEFFAELEARKGLKIPVINKLER